MNFVDALMARIEQLEARVAALESRKPPRPSRAALGTALEEARRLLVFDHGRRPKFWSDPEVRDWLTGQHRRLDMNAALAACRDLFGASRTPSRSALHRYWQKLDKLIRTAA